MESSWQVPSTIILWYSLFDPALEIEKKEIEISEPKSQGIGLRLFLDVGNQIAETIRCDCCKSGIPFSKLTIVSHT